MNVHEILLHCLEELDSEKLDLLKWHLTKRKPKAIPKSELEKKSKCDIVDSMIQHYQPEGAVKHTLIILKKMKQMDLAKKLRDKQAKLCPKTPAAKKKPTTTAPKKAAESHRKTKSVKPKVEKPKATETKNTAPKKAAESHRKTKSVKPKVEKPKATETKNTAPKKK